MPARHYAPAENAVNLFESVFKSILVPLPKDFPIAYWCRLVDKTKLVVNMVHPCRQTPRLSTWAACEGEFHFNATLIPQLGFQILMCQKPARRNAFASNLKKVWYLGPCTYHYRTFRGLLPSTRGKRMSDLVKV